MGNRKHLFLITFYGRHKIRPYTLEVYRKPYTMDMSIIYITRTFVQLVRNGIFYLQGL